MVGDGGRDGARSISTQPSTPCRGSLGCGGSSASAVSLGSRESAGPALAEEERMLGLS
jgi:hypothetical protein